MFIWIFLITKTQEITSCSYALKSWNTLYVFPSLEMIPPRYLKVVTCSSSASSITSLHWTGSLAIVRIFVLEVETAMLYVFAVVQNLFSNSCSFIFWIGNQKRILKFRIATLASNAMIVVRVGIRGWRFRCISHTHTPAFLAGPTPTSKNRSHRENCRPLDSLSASNNHC